MKIIAITSGKGGTGKSCIAAYTGAALAQAGQRVLLIEMGAAPRSLDVILNLPETTLFHVRDLLDGTCGFAQSWATAPAYDKLHVILAAPTPAKQAVTGEELARLLGLIPARFDYILLDGVDFGLVAPTMPDMILQIVTPDSLCVRATAAHNKALLAGGAQVENTRLILNQVPPQMAPIKDIEDFDDIIDLVQARLLAVLPASPKLQYASNHGGPLWEDSIVPRIFTAIASRLQGNDVPLLVR